MSSIIDTDKSLTEILIIEDHKSTIYTYIYINNRTTVQVMVAEYRAVAWEATCDNPYLYCAMGSIGEFTL